MTIELPEYVIDAIANAIVKKMPKQKTGHWIVISPTDMYCSECHVMERLDTNRKFCVHCGAKMEGEKC